jgi:hypothetical protein
MLSTLMAHEAQLNPVTGKLFLTDVSMSLFFVKDNDKQQCVYYEISGTIYKIFRFCTAIYTSSSGFRLFSLTCLKWLGVNPVTFLNWPDK